MTTEFSQQIHVKQFLRVKVTKVKVTICQGIFPLHLSHPS